MSNLQAVILSDNRDSTALAGAVKKIIEFSATPLDQTGGSHEMMFRIRNG
jgi:hypothetical protein